MLDGDPGERSQIKLCSHGRDLVIGNFLSEDERLDFAEALELPRDGGLLVQEVAHGSAASTAGIKSATQLVNIGNAQVGIGGDLIISVDGVRVVREDAISRALGKKRAGDTLTLTLVRKGRTSEVKVKLGEAPDQL